MRVLVVMDKFKDALTAPTAGRVVAEAVQAARPGWVIDVCPLTDGGDGFASILTEAAGGVWCAREVAGPLEGQRVQAGFGRISREQVPRTAHAMLPAGVKHLALVDLASASGLIHVPPERRDPWQTSTAGVGQLIAAAAGEGADAVLLGIGGSATHDVALGALLQLGWQALDAAGRRIAWPAPRCWARVERLVPPDRRWPQLLLACDVTNPLLGPAGAATVFAPQKGLRRQDLPALESATARMMHLLCASAGVAPALAERPGAGAAGGVGFGLMAGAGAQLLPGYDLVAAWLGLEQRLAAADLVITGEGRFDGSSLQGKGPGSLVVQAVSRGQRVLVLAGQVATAVPSGVDAVAISPPDLPLAEALPQTAARLASAVTAWLGTTRG